MLRRSAMREVVKIGSFTLVLLVAVWLMACPLRAQRESKQSTPRLTGAEAEHRFTAKDIFSLQHATDVQISPDGRRIAYVRMMTNIMTDSEQSSIWLLDVATGKQRQWAGLSSSSPRWSPDGTHIAYLASDLHGATQAFVRPVDSLTAVALTHSSQSPDQLRWSPDGRSVAFIQLVPGPLQPSPDITPAKPQGANWAPSLKVITAVHYTADGAAAVTQGVSQLFVVSATRGKPRQLTTDSFGVPGQFSWMPDSTQILFSGNRNEDHEFDQYYRSSLWAVQVADGVVHPFVSLHDHESGPVPSPDGSLIAYTGYDLPKTQLKPPAYLMTHLYVMDRDGSHGRMLAAQLDRDAGQVTWSPDGRGLYLSYADHGLSKIGFVGLDGTFSTAANPLASGDYSVSSSGILAFSLDGPDHPPEVGIATTGEHERRLTTLNAELLGNRKLAKVEPLAVKSSFDGLPIDAWMVTPPDYDPSRAYPMILVIHGGPYGADGPSWSSQYQLFASAGYVVVYANPRGSISYGSAFSYQINYDFPDHDYDDLMSVVDAAIARGVADPARLFVTGGSAGGELTAWIVGKTKRFKAAAALKPVIDQTSDILTSDQYLVAGNLFGNFPWQDPSSFWKHSPLSLVGKVATPTLLMVGEEDRRTPPGEAEQFYDALQLRRIPTELVLVPGASHESLSRRPSQQAAEISILLQWFAKYDPHHS
jgi:dipeptidyl aminopeptidase/acylaminoacyl peptidase